MGIKDTAGNIVQLAELVRYRRRFLGLCGNAGYLRPPRCGAVGATAATANILPDMCRQVVDLNQESWRGKGLQQRLLEPNGLVTFKHGIPALKAAMDMLGYRACRRPLKLLGLKKEI